jgi:hypothetical protein
MEKGYILLNCGMGGRGVKHLQHFQRGVRTGSKV